ncbi:hypothetical protein JANAI62_10240 [Jannaschia pagri]|uniref:Uncharacterized protein n=1 Tax=Jannaschia pagri TaxID=2829797 RepID=A0ABQ4NJ18_9RHOB|nr:MULTISPECIES: hypothetical protein [unclassified Jannaschia]GIT90569.1 hypothetical protein JANAI61_10270 [Jannaschia sp. AI_61]GIT94401.1 hypothetical protein JANAI62_10240 [Jannaschia sp. AI_62]
MGRTLLTSLTILAIVIFLLAPRMTAVAAEVMPNALRVIVICVGNTMQTIVIDAEGKPVEVSDDASPCPLVADLAGPVQPVPFWQRLQLAWQPDLTRPHRAAQPAPNLLRPPGRAPPVTT